MNQYYEQTEEFARSLSQLVKGLTILFWGIPLTLVICVRTSVKDKFELQPVDFWIPIVATGSLLLALSYISKFRKNERVWIEAIDRARFFAIINFFLSPFIYWRLKITDVQVFSVAAGMFFLSGIFFLLMINRVIKQLALMLPEYSLREDARIYADLNQYILVILSAILILNYIGAQWGDKIKMLPSQIWLAARISQWVISFIIVAPVAMTMTLIWKARDVILKDVFINACRPRQKGEHGDN